MPVKSGFINVGIIFHGNIHARSGTQRHEVYLLWGSHLQLNYKDFARGQA